jgi:hypothetical protein
MTTAFDTPITRPEKVGTQFRITNVAISYEVQDALGTNIFKDAVIYGPDNIPAKMLPELEAAVKAHAPDSLANR